MPVIGEAAVSGFLKLLVHKSLNSAPDFVADHKQLDQQLKQWQSILLDIQVSPWLNFQKNLSVLDINLGQQHTSTNCTWPLLFHLTRYPKFLHQKYLKQINSFGQIIILKFIN
ncbi:hypothetical protein ES332_D11G363200v1 [Gossypium tomentosum]|uniref:Uncharacterized protein n=1 Tax=Gossypium tomentosum TaxID=34277 RepID=A0A5D2IXY2_GOSTO|nr:hypothetical protein ES332_D11G363200v1 [Gossypium tomentosum]